MDDTKKYDFTKLREAATYFREEKDNITSEDFTTSLSVFGSQTVDNINDSFLTYDRMFYALRNLYKSTADYLDLICDNYEEAEDAIIGG
ncbi:MAG: hypothetical protein J6U23_08820 [Clostridiales bacterium]|nr:hypothetical protein [Clostridiales bacterium]